MDPDEALRIIRDLVSRVRAADGFVVAHDALDLAEHVQALDEWLTRGGAPPLAWLTEIQEV